MSPASKRPSAAAPMPARRGMPAHVAHTCPAGLVAAGATTSAPPPLTSPPRRSRAAGQRLRPPGPRPPPVLAAHQRLPPIRAAHGPAGQAHARRQRHDTAIPSRQQVVGHIVFRTTLGLATASLASDDPAAAAESPKPPPQPPSPEMGTRHATYSRSRRRPSRG
jgi:hypothetical protein